MRITLPAILLGASLAAAGLALQRVNTEAAVSAASQPSAAARTQPAGDQSRTKPARQRAETATPRPMRFLPVAVYLDSKGEPIGAYQFEFEAGPSGARIVGIEGGAHPAFDDPPYYDPKAMQGDKLIAAAFSTNEPEQLPKGKTRIATVHLAVPGDAAPDVQLTLETATDHAGNTIAATISKRVKGTNDE
jgi:hypothetical protein